MINHDHVSISFINSSTHWFPPDWNISTMTTTKSACWTNYQKISSCWIVSGHNLKAPKSETTDTLHQFHLIWRNSSWFVLFWRLPKNKSISNSLWRWFMFQWSKTWKPHDFFLKTIFKNMWVWLVPPYKSWEEIQVTMSPGCPKSEAQDLVSGTLQIWKTGMLWRFDVCMHVTYAWRYA